MAQIWVKNVRFSSIFDPKIDVFGQNSKFPERGVLQLTFLYIKMHSRYLRHLRKTGVPYFTISCFGLFDRGDPFKHGIFGGLTHRNF